VDGEAWDYALDHGRWAPSPDPRPSVPWLPEAQGRPAGTSPCLN
jgi:hypothetical protein